MHHDTTHPASPGGAGQPASMEASLRIAARAARRRRPALGLILLLAAASLLLILTACSDRGGAPGGKDSSSGTTATSTADTAAGQPAITANGPFAPATAEMGSDSIPLRAPDGGLARFGLASGRIVQEYAGSRRGHKLLLFDHYGMREYREDSSAPYPGGTPGPFQNNLFISTPEYFGSIDRTIRQGWRRPNVLDEFYLKSDSSKRFSLGDIIFLSAAKVGKRLPDTVINGYHCKVIKISQPGFTDTRWIWRGIVLRQHFEPMQGGDFTVETVELTPGVTVPDSVFRFPSNYNVQDLPAIDPSKPPTPDGGVPLPPGRVPGGAPPGILPGAPGAPGLPPGGGR